MGVAFTKSFSAIQLSPSLDFKKMIEIAFINLIWSGIPSFNFQVDDSTLNLRIHSQILGFNFSTQGLFELEESLLNYGSQS